MRGRQGTNILTANANLRVAAQTGMTVLKLTYETNKLIALMI